MNSYSKYDDIIGTAVKCAAGVGVAGGLLPGVDIAAMSTTWIVMITAIAHRSGHPMSEHMAAKVIAAIGRGVTAYIAGSKIFTYLLHFIPGIGTLGVLSINSILNAVYTQRLGKQLVTTFERSNFSLDEFAVSSVQMAKLIIGMPSSSELRELASTIF